MYAYWPHTVVYVLRNIWLVKWYFRLFLAILLVFVLHKPNKQVSFFPTTTTIKQKRTCENEWLNSQFCSMKQLEMERVSVALRMKLHVSISISWTRVISCRGYSIATIYSNSLSARISFSSSSSFRLRNNRKRKFPFRFLFSTGAWVFRPWPFRWDLACDF